MVGDPQAPITAHAPNKDVHRTVVAMNAFFHAAAFGWDTRQRRLFPAQLLA